MKIKVIVSTLFLILLFFLYRFTIYNPALESTTQNIDVISKEQSETISEQWIVLSNDKRVYVENHSI